MKALTIILGTLAVLAAVATIACAYAACWTSGALQLRFGDTAIASFFAALFLGIATGFAWEES
jgi:hypothetical protein